MARAVPTVVHVGADVQSLVPAQFRSGGQGRQTLRPRAVAVTLFPMKSARYTAKFVLVSPAAPAGRPGKMWPAGKGSPAAVEAPLGLELVRDCHDPRVFPRSWECGPVVVTENSWASPLSCRMRLIFPDSGPLEESFRTTASTFARFVSAAKLFEASPFSAFSLHLYSSHFVLVRLRRQTAVPSSPTE